LLRRLFSFLIGGFLLFGNITGTNAACSDPKVLEAQEWLNKTYAGKSGYTRISTDGRPGVALSETLVSALQIELGTSKITGIFGPETEEKFNKQCGVLKQGNEDKGKPYIKILQYALFCKGQSYGSYGKIWRKNCRCCFKTKA